MLVNQDPLKELHVYVAGVVEIDEKMPVITNCKTAINNVKKAQRERSKSQLHLVYIWTYAKRNKRQK
jgi:hypothetical protein